MSADVKRVDVVAVPAGVLGQWRGVVTVNGLPEYRTSHTFDSADGATRAAERFRGQAETLAAEDAALAACEKSP